VGIENKEVHHPAKVEHPPGSAAIVGDVRTRHIARDEHGVDVVRTDRRIKHCAAAAGTDDPESAWPFGESAGQAHYDKNNESNKDSEFH